ncbi:MAG: ATP-binding protein [Halobacteria archaeon]
MTSHESRSARNQGSYIVIGLAFSIVVIAVIHFFTQPSTHPSQLELIMNLVPSVSLIYLGYWLRGKDLNTQNQKRVAYWTIVGAAFVIFSMGVQMMVKLAAGMTLSNVVGHVLLFANIGGIGGFTAGYFRSRSEEQKHNLKENKQRLDIARQGTDTGIWEWDTERDEVWMDEIVTDMIKRIRGEDVKDNEIFRESSGIDDFLEYVDPRDHEEVKKTLEKSVEEKTGFRTEFRIGDRENTSLWIEARGEVQEKSGRSRIVAMMTNVSEFKKHKEMEKKLRKSNEKLEQFAYVASHDLHEPLRTISSYTEILEEDFGDQMNEEAERLFDVILTASERMQSMIDGLLNYSRVSTRGGEFESVDVEEVIKDVQEDLSFMIEEEDGNIEYGDLPVVQADPDQLNQVFQNLIKNALEHSGDGPANIEIDGEASSGKYRLEVSDDGEGIASSVQDNLFQMFSSSKQYNTESQAKGIGLAVCEQIVNRHDGEIWVESPEGEGATFNFTLKKRD